MLTKFSVKNYRTFRNEVTLDFTKIRDYQFNTDCIINNCAGKIIIYGRNGAGKTNLGHAIEDIGFTLSRSGTWQFADSSFLNANSDEKYASFTYCFAFGNDTAEYFYQKASLYETVYEKLVINGKTVFAYDHAENKFLENNISDFGLDTLDVSKYTLENAFVDGYKAPFLTWVFSNSSLGEDSVIGKIRRFSMSMCFKGVGSIRTTSSPLLRHFLKYPEFISDLENYLNAMGIDCSLAAEKNLNGETELFYKFDKRLIPFNDAASSGVKDLFAIFTSIFCRVLDDSLIFIDEFDAFFHYELSERLVNYLKKYYPNNQVILTSHNTNLISNRILRPDCYLILSMDGRLTPLCDATARELREGHNLEKLYQSGEFERYE